MVQVRPGQWLEKLEYSDYVADSILLIEHSEQNVVVETCNKDLD